MYAKYTVLKLYLNFASNAEGREMEQDAVLIAGSKKKKTPFRRKKALFPTIIHLRK